MSLSEPTFFEKLQNQFSGLVPFELKLLTWDSQSLEEERRRLSSVVLLRARQGKNREADLAKLRKINEKLAKEKTSAI